MSLVRRMLAFFREAFGTPRAAGDGRRSGGTM